MDEGGSLDIASAARYGSGGGLGVDAVGLKRPSVAAKTELGSAGH